ncbi:oxidoreductase [Alicyclobacillus suci]|uniref:oxidoreductase n=1 Tax=Alicyclobacillus suci TaxID=2816080 RepID=UPI002E28A579|nr:oxidoreductase [Alicyclobacillus suci]
MTQNTDQHTHRRVWLITGASRGLGNAIAQAALDLGDAVVATSRNPVATANSLIGQANQLLSLAMDVTDKQQIASAVQSAIAHFGRIDVLVNNAGYGLMGAVEEVSDEEARAVFDTNVFGLLAVTRAVLPILREQRSGHIVNISSVAGVAAGVGSGIYAATKFAVEGFSEALSAEVAPLGIHVSLVEPGQFRTDFLADSLKLAEKTIPDYDETAGQVVRALKERNGKQAGHPGKAAAAIIQLVQSERPTLRLPLGVDCLERMERKLSAVAADIESWRDIALHSEFDA